MSVFGYVSLKFHPLPLPSYTLSILRSAGWLREVAGAVWFQHYASVEDIGGDQEAPAAEWEAVQADLDERYRTGETVAIRHGFQGTDADVWFYFHQESDGIQEMWASLQEPRPRLCERFTDFGWYLPKIVRPLYEAGHNILEVTCHDDAY